MEINKQQIVDFMKKVIEIATDPVNNEVHKNKRYMDPSKAENTELAGRLRDSFIEIGNLVNSGLNVLNPAGTKENDDPNTYSIERHPIFVSDNSCILISVFHATNSLNHMFVTDFIDYRKQTKVAAKDIIKQISEVCSVQLLWSLKEAINEELEDHNKEFGTSFPMERPKKDDNNGG